MATLVNLIRFLKRPTDLYGTCYVPQCSKFFLEKSFKYQLKKWISKKVFIFYFWKVLKNFADSFRLIKSLRCCVVTSYPLSKTFCAKIPHKFSIGLVCGTFGGIGGPIEKGKFPFIYASVSLEWPAPTKSCTNWKLKSPWFLWFFDSCEICNLTLVDSLLFGGWPVSSILPS